MHDLPRGGVTAWRTHGSRSDRRRPPREVGAKGEPITSRPIPSRKQNKSPKVRTAKAGGVRGVHIRTELLAPAAVIEEVVAAGVDVVSIEIDAACGETYRRMHGIDRHRDVLQNAERLLAAMRAHPLGGDAAVIGEVIEDPHQFVQMQTAFGGSRMVDWLTGEQLPRIC
jgi:hypothetical protein